MSHDDMEFEIKLLTRRCDKFDADLREQFGLIKELTGRVAALVDQKVIHDQLSEIRQVNTRQSTEIGNLSGVISVLRDALTKSSDHKLAEAAKGITINVEGGRGGSSASVGSTARDAVLIEGNQLNNPK